jgi:sodium-coupled neutral amino acid transporter 11
MAASGSRSVRFAEDVDAASAPLFSLESPGSSPRPSYEQPRPPPGAAASGSTPPRLPLAHGLRSTMSSREAQFDADSDELSDSDAAAADLGASPGRAAPSSGGMRTGIPLIDRIPVPVRARQSMDGLSDGLEGIRNQIQDIELPDWLKKGAGVWDATVNMANSILGAGVVGECGQAGGMRQQRGGGLCWSASRTGANSSLTTRRQVCRILCGRLASLPGLACSSGLPC